MLPHKGQVFHRRATAAVTGRGLNPINTEFAANFAETNLALVLEVAVLEDHLDRQGDDSANYSIVTKLRFLNAHIVGWEHRPDCEQVTYPCC